MKSYDVTEWGKPLQMRVHETPAPKGREVLLRLTHCGVCHSDVHVRDGYFDMGGGRKLSLADRGLKLPVTLGHEPLGVVAAVGEAVTGVKLGGSYLVNPWIGCGTCRMCAANNDNLCANMRALGIAAPGGFATHVLVRDPRYLIDASGIDAARAAPLTCSGVTTFCAVKKLQPLDPEDWVAVLGCGGLGLMALAVLLGLGHRKIIACDIDDAKLAVARQRGAGQTCNLKTEGLKRLAEIAPGGMYGMLDFVGVPQTVALAVPAMRKGGRFVLCGLIGGEASLPIPAFGMREIAILGSAVGNTRDIVELVALVRAGRIVPPEVERRPLAAAESALADLAAGRVKGRIVLETQGEA
jgi:D-arabinose 1-dehydrogenase-like Zn-dependent alcohol dehydrogenase